MQNAVFICLEKLLQTGNVQMWLCKPTDELERLSVATWAAQLPSPLLPAPQVFAFAEQPRTGRETSLRSEGAEAVRALCSASRHKPD